MQNDSLSNVRLDDRKIAHLTFTDPTRLNAMGLEMSHAFRAAQTELKELKPRVIILSGIGKSFSAGGDLAMLEAKQHQSLEENRTQMLEFYQSFLGILDLQVPIIAAIQGYAVGAGCILAAACDLRVGESNAKFSTPFLRMGLYPGMGTTLFLPRAFGSKAIEMLLTGEIITAEQAHQSGFLHRLCGDGQSQQVALELAHSILKSAPEITSQVLGHMRPSRELVLQHLQQEAFHQGASYLAAEFQIGLEAVKCKQPSPFE